MAGHRFSPFPVLKTARLTLRQLADRDDQEIFALRADPAVNKYLDRQPSKTIDDARTFIRIICENIRVNDSLYWAITLNGTDKLIGTICLFDFSADHQKAEIGYELLPGFQGKGIMQEAAAEVIHFALQDLQLNSITAGTHRDNQGSARLLEKLEFIRQGAVDDHFILFSKTSG